MIGTDVPMVCFCLLELQLPSLEGGPPGTEGIADVSWTRAMKRLFKIVGECFKNKEPILLVGDTGCGKTTVCPGFCLSSAG